MACSALTLGGRQSERVNGHFPIQMPAASVISFREESMVRIKSTAPGPFVSVCLVALVPAIPGGRVGAQTVALRRVSGVVVTKRNESVPTLMVIVRWVTDEKKTAADADGNFSLAVPLAADGTLTLRAEEEYIVSPELRVGPRETTENLQLEVRFVAPPVHESVVIVASSLDPTIERRNDTVYRNTLFGRDEQLLFTLDAGIGAGQHEGGGKSLEIRRFGYNLDHGGVNGGSKILVDDLQQNQGTQGHGQGLPSGKSWRAAR